MRTPQADMSIFKERRAKLAQRISGGALILTAHPEYIRNNDVHYPYRQDSNFYYLTGFEEPGSIFMFIPGAKEEAVLFVRDKDPERETWDGFRYGPEGAYKHFGVDAAYSIHDFMKLAPEMLKDVDKIYYSLFHNFSFDQKIHSVLEHVKVLNPRSGRGNLTIEDSYGLLGELRIFKSPYEIEMLRNACKLTSEAHIAVMKATRPGVNERALHGLFIKEIFERGAAREGYNGIFATGDNATTLHYVFNDQTLKEGELFLIDAGGEYLYYTADITRTYPVSGKFSAPQRRLYQSVLDLQKSLIDMVRPGVSLVDLQKTAVSVLTDIMLAEGLLSGDKERLIRDLEYKRYYPHNIGHWLGSDVHDAGLSKINGEPRRFEPGMVFTIEPGIYIPGHDQKAPAELRGIGIRIEDNVVVTEKGCEVLTSLTPKEVPDLEAIIGTV